MREYARDNVQIINIYYRRGTPRTPRKNKLAVSTMSSELIANFRAARCHAQLHNQLLLSTYASPTILIQSRLLLPDPLTFMETLVLKRRLYVHYCTDQEIPVCSVRA